MIQKRVRQIFLNKYQDSPFIIQQKTNVLLWIQFVLIPVIIIYIFINIFRNNPRELIGIIVIDCLFLFSMVSGVFLIKKGKYDLAVNLNISTVTILTIGGHLVKRFVQAETGFNSFSVLMFAVIIFTAMFSRRRILSIVSLIFLVLTISLYVFAKKYGPPSMHFYLMSGTLNTVIVIIIAYCLSYYNGTITDKALEITQNELDKNTELNRTLERKVEERTLELSNSNERLKQEIEERKQAEEALMESEKRFRELSIVDELTSLYNSRHFYFQLKIELERSNRYKQHLTLLMLDLDNFKALNDTYGHIEGDKVLKRLGQVIKKCLRKTDSAYRYGGEEFTILLPMTTGVNGVVIAERIRAEFNNETFSPEPGENIHLTVSIGITQYKPQEDMKSFVNRVDQLMYQAKKNGKDRVCSEA